MQRPHRARAAVEEHRGRPEELLLPVRRAPHGPSESLSLSLSVCVCLALTLSAVEEHGGGPEELLLTVRRAPHGPGESLSLSLSLCVSLARSPSLLNVFQYFIVCVVLELVIHKNTSTDTHHPMHVPVSLLECECLCVSTSCAGLVAET